MYGTKLSCDKHDAFYKMGPLCLGDPYFKKAHVDSRLKGVQFRTNPGKIGKQGAFSKFNSLNSVPGEGYKSDPYFDHKKAAKGKVQRQGQFGFNSKDAANRDEFSSEMNVSRYREKMHYENKHIFKNLTKRSPQAEAGERIAQSAPLYDAIFKDSGNSRFDRSPLSYTKPHQTHRPLGLGIYKTSSRDVGAKANLRTDDMIAEHGRIQVCKEFNDHGNL